MGRVHLTTYISILYIATCPIAASAEPPPSTQPSLSEPAVHNVAVRLESGGSELIERIRGQTSDLKVRLRTVPIAALERSLRAQLRAADTLIGAGVDAVIWFRKRRQRFYIYALAKGSSRVLIRSMAISKGRLDSATLEATSLVVRTALRSIVRGQPIGVQRELALKAEKATPPNKVISISKKKKKPERRIEQRRLWSFRGSVGAHVSIDGVSPAGQWGPLLRLEYVYRWVAIGLIGAPSIAANIEDNLARLTIAKQSLAATVAAYIPLSTSFYLRGGVAGGVVLLTRSTQASRADVIAAPKTINVSGLIAPELSLGWLPSALGHRLGLTLTLAAHVVVPQTQLRYASAGQPLGQPRHDIFTVQPYLALAVAFRVP